MNPGNNISITTTLAKIVSVVFHPLFMPLYGLVIIFTAPTMLGFLPAEVKKILFLVILMNNVVLPVILLPFFRSWNIISSYIIDDREERIIPLVATSILYSVTSYIFFRFHLPAFLKVFVLSSTFLVIVLTIISLWWKISIHGAAAGALIAVVVALSFQMSVSLVQYLIPAILTGSIILSSRLKLNSHNPMQAWTGFLIGFFVLCISSLLI